MHKLIKKAASLASYPFLYVAGLAIGWMVLIWEKRLHDERLRQERERQVEQSRWLAGLEDDSDPWTARPSVK